MIIVECDPQSYLHYAEGLPRTFFSHMLPYIAAQAEAGMDVRLLALKESEKIRGVAKLILRPYKRFFRLAELSYAPLFQAEDRACLPAFMQALEAYLRKDLRIVRLRVAPLRDLQATPSIKAQMLALGFSALDGDFYQKPWLQPRHLFVKDLSGMDEAALFASLSYRVRNDMRRAERSGVQLSFLAPEEVGRFNRLLELTIERTGMDKAHAQFLTAKQLAITGDLSYLPIAHMELPKAIQGMADQLAELDVQQKRLTSQQDSPRQQRRVAALEEQREGLLRRQASLLALEKEHGPAVDLAGAQFALSSTDLVYVQSASHPDFLHFAGIYAIHERMLRLALEKKLGYYNFFAVEDPASREDGVLAFKERFGGAIESHPGSFEKALRLKALQKG